MFDGIPDDVLAVIDDVDAMVQRALGDRLVATYVHGSLAMGGYNRTSSDVDLLLIADDDPPIGHDEIAHVGHELVELQSPGRGIELSVVGRGDAADPSSPWPFMLHVTTNATDHKIVDGRTRPGDPDLILHYAVIRQAGIPVRGPAPPTLVGAVRRDTLLRALADELDWAVDDAGEAYTVLNAGRALAFLEGGELVAKVQGAEWAARHGLDRNIVERALAVQSGNVDDRPRPNQPSPLRPAFETSSRTRRLADTDGRDGRANIRRRERHGHP